MAAEDAVDAVVIGHPIVQISVVGAQQLLHGPILADLAFEEELGFARHRLAQVWVEGANLLIDVVCLQVADLKPLLREVVNEPLGARIREHARHLLREHRRLPQRALRGGRQQVVIGQASPQEK